MLSQISFHFLMAEYNIPVCVNITFSLSVHPMDIWIGLIT